MCKLCAKCGKIIPPAPAAKSRRIPDSQSSPPPQHGALAPSLRGTKQSIGGRTTAEIATALRASQ
jgi:hypothetical protein